ncbi:CBS domain-containing protein [Legionella impletisoli]|uniref:CBS domain-containing protein n=3 Tax=Bacteria TaxID=2 RepID=A0A917JQ48_9GAMM|nr:CBS domain-containing protein [Legionella impletisoli]GGI80974.1 CBS domain-containing protein [Legionella impletisoli]
MAHILRSLLPQPRRPIVKVYPDVVVKQGVELMVHENIGALVVADEDDFYGVLSERDIIRFVVYKDLSPETTKISEVMCADITILSITDTIEKAMEAMTLTKRRHILIEEDEKIVAIVSIGDILYNLLEDRAKTIEHLEKYIHTY